MNPHEEWLTKISKVNNEYHDTFILRGEVLGLKANERLVNSRRLSLFSTIGSEYTIIYKFTSKCRETGFLPKNYRYSGITKEKYTPLESESIKSESDRMSRFYQDHVFDHIDHNKWIKYEPRHYYVERNGTIVAGLTIIKRETMDHIWLCGVKSDERGKGLFANLIKQFKQNCTNVISVATYPKKWVDMYAWIQKKGGKLIHESPDGKCVFTILKDNL